MNVLIWKSKTTFNGLYLFMKCSKFFNSWNLKLAPSWALLLPVYLGTMSWPCWRTQTFQDIQVVSFVQCWTSWVSKFRSFEVSNSEKCFKVFLFHVFVPCFFPFFCRSFWCHLILPGCVAPPKASKPGGDLVVFARSVVMHVVMIFMCMWLYILYIHIYIYYVYMYIWLYIYIYIFIWSWTLNPLNLLTLVVWHTLLWFPPCNPCGP